MEVYEVFNVDVEDIISLNSEERGLDFVIFHVYSGGICASHVFDVRLVFYMDSWFDVVS